MSKMIDYLKASAGEASLLTRLGFWRQAVSLTVDQLVELVAQISGGGLLPATGTTQGSRPLSGYNTALLQTGDEVFVQGINEVYYYDATSALAADQLNVVNAVGPGQFIRSGTVVTQADWYVDSVNGDDENPGTAAAPLQTLGELAKRLNGKMLWSSITNANVYLSAGTYTEPLVLTPTLPLASQIMTVWGTMTQHFTGTVTAFTAFNSGAGTRMQFTDAAADFSTLRRRIRMTSGAANNGLSWYGSINGATTAQPNSFVNPVGQSAATVTPAIGNTYVVESCATSLPFVSVEVGGAGLCIVRDIKYTASTGSRVFMSGNATRARFAGCEIDSTTAAAILAGSVGLAACAVTGNNGCTFISYNGITLQGMSFLGGAFNALWQGYFFGNNILHDGAGAVQVTLSITNGASLEDSGTQSGHACFGCVGGAALVVVDDFGRWALAGASCRFWGAAGNTATVALKVVNGSGVLYNTLPTATGVAPGTDVVLANAAGAAWATMPAVAAAPDNAYVSVRQ